MIAFIRNKQTQKIETAGEDMEQLELFCIASGNYCWKQYGDLLNY